MAVVAALLSASTAAKPPTPLPLSFFSASPKSWNGGNSQTATAVILNNSQPLQLGAGAFLCPLFNARQKVQHPRQLHSGGRKLTRDTLRSTKPPGGFFDLRFITISFRFFSIFFRLVETIVESIHDFSQVSTLQKFFIYLCSRKISPHVKNSSNRHPLHLRPRR